MFIVNTTSLLAVDPTATTTPKPTGLRQEFREERRELMDDLKENRQETRTTIAKNRQEQRQARLQAVYNEMVKSLNLRLNSYLSFKAKIQARITERSATRDVTQAQSKLNEFDPLVTTYNTHLTALSTKLTETLALEKPATQLGELKKAANSARDDLKDMRRVLTDTIRLLVKSPAKP